MLGEHVQIVLNIALRLFRLLIKAGVEPALVGDHGMRERDSEVVVAGGALLHDVGMSIHRADHEAFSLFQVDDLLATKLRGTPLEEHVEVLALIEGETEAPTDRVPDRGRLTPVLWRRT